jgi:hypothetical protein
VCIRKVPLFQTGLTTNDCAVLFTGTVDSIAVTAQSLQFSCSSSLGALSYLLPSENMHAACRFRYADDNCTQIAYLPENYFAGTCGASSSTTNVKSGGLTQDTAASGGYGTDLVDALSTAAITASSQAVQPIINVSCRIVLNQPQIYFTNASAPMTGGTVVFSGTAMPHWVIYRNNMNSSGGTITGGTLIAGYGYQILTASSNSMTICDPVAFPGYTYFFVLPGSGLIFSATSPPSPSGLNNAAATVNTTTDKVTITAHGQANNTPVTLGGTALPAPLAAGTVYFLINVTTNDFQLAATSGGGAINLTTTGTGVTVSTLGLIGAFGVQASQGTGWSFTTTADWGNTAQGYWQIPDAQAGLKNAALKPYLQFDFGSAVQPKTWRVASFAGVQPEMRVRLVLLFSSPDAATWKFESYFELPKTGGQLFDVLIPKATSNRYWRICIRSRWAETLYYLMFKQVSAYAGSRNWWMNGQITFDGNVTAALKGVTRTVRTSFSGELFCAPLPVAPASGDTYVVKRGCGRTFNACAARLNTENYGGFNDLELQNIVISK